MTISPESGKHMKMEMSRSRNILAAALIGSLGFMGAVASARAADKPNIVFILTDNLG